MARNATRNADERADLSLNAQVIVMGLGRTMSVEGRLALETIQARLKASHNARNAMTRR